MADIEMEMVAEGVKVEDSPEIRESVPRDIRLPQPSTGSWLHAGYHLTTGTAGASTPNLPAAIAGLGWSLGVFCLTMFAFASFYTYYCLIRVLDHFEKNGRRYQRYGEVSKELIGKRWTLCAVAPLQLVVCFTTVVSFVLIGGQSLKAICYDYSQPSTSLGLSIFIVIFGIASTILSQMPTFHSLRHLNLVSFVSSIMYAILIVSGSIISYYSTDKPKADYSLLGTTNKERVMNAFNAFSILSTMFGNALLVETQATISSPIKKNMVQGLVFCYVATIATFFPVAVAGYWAFGNMSNSNILLSMVSNTGMTYIPSWMFILGNLCMIVQLIAASVLYAQPTFEIIERTIHQKSNNSRPILCKFILRLILRTCFMLLATLLAAMLPFFGDFNAIVGALGYTPLVFIYPIIFHLKCFKVRPFSMNFSTHSFLLLIFATTTIIGTFASIRQFVLDEKTFKLFANL